MATTDQATPDADGQTGTRPWLPLSLPAPIDFAWCLSAAIIVVAVSFLPLLKAFDQKLYDMRVRLVSLMVDPIPEIVIVAIDDQSLAELKGEFGRFPWPRSIYADLVDFLRHARTIAFDVLYTEPDVEDPASDARFVQAVARHGGVISSAYIKNRTDGDVSNRDMRAYAFPGAALSLKTELVDPEWLTPFPALLKASAALGMVNYRSESDGILRAHRALVKTDTAVYPSLSLATVSHYLQISMSEITHNSDGLHIGEQTLHPDDYGRIRLCPPSTPYATFGIADIYNAARQTPLGNESSVVSPELFRDKIVFIGSTATGLQADFQVTPMGVYVPGVLNHAIAADGLLTGREFQTATAWTPLIILIICMIPAFLHVQRPRTMAFIALAILLVYAGITLGALYSSRTMLPVAAPLMGLVVSCSALGGYRWQIERLRRRELEQLDAAKQIFTDMLVHDMRNQLQPVLMSLDVLQMTIQKQPNVVELIERARVTAKRLLGLVNGLLDVRKMQQGRMQLSRIPSDPVGVVVEAMREFEVAASTAHLEFAYRTPGVVPREISIDPNLFSRVIENLIWNAIQHSPRDTAIELGCEFADNRDFEVWIANRGNPIPAESQAELFEPFVSGDESDKEFAKGGTGLGLTFCKMAIDAHGGSIEIISPYYDDGGVKFVVTLPVPD